MNYFIHEKRREIRNCLVYKNGNIIIDEKYYNEVQITLEFITIIEERKNFLFEHFSIYERCILKMKFLKMYK